MNMKIIFVALLSLVVTSCTQQQPQQRSTESQTATSTAAERPARVAVHVEPQQPGSGQEAKLIAELRDPDGKPISDAEMKATAVMKMGEMGDMRETATLKWNGARYEGALKISMAGDWNVMVEAIRHGRVIATETTQIKAK
jgi:hypothetical protein